MVYTLHRRQWVPTDLDATFAFFARPQNLPLITPPSLGFRIETPEPIVMAADLTLDCTVRILGVRRRWRSVIAEYDPPHGFRDVQAIGPYRVWDHRHCFRAAADGTVVQDIVVYEPPLGPLGAMLNRLVIRPQLDALFDHRRARIAALLGVGARA
jgi:ligand-binding SRPBCC domain-containing protein